MTLELNSLQAYEPWAINMHHWKICESIYPMSLEILQIYASGRFALFYIDIG